MGNIFGNPEYYKKKAEIKKNKEKIIGAENEYKRSNRKQKHIIEIIVEDVIEDVTNK